MDPEERRLDPQGAQMQRASRLLCSASKINICLNEHEHTHTRAGGGGGGGGGCCYRRARSPAEGQLSQKLMAAISSSRKTRDD